MTEIIKQPEAESRLSKQVLGKLQTENSCDHKHSTLRKNRVAYKET